MLLIDRPNNRAITRRIVICKVSARVFLFISVFLSSSPHIHVYPHRIVIVIDLLSLQNFFLFISLLPSMSLAYLFSDLFIHLQSLKFSF